MKNNIKTLAAICFSMVSIAIIAIGVIYTAGFLTDGKVNSNEIKKPYVAVIAKSTTSAFWKSVSAGASAAGTEYNLTISFEGPESEENYEGQNELIYEAVENGAAVIVFSAVDYNANKEAIDYAAKKGIKIVVIDSDVNSDYISCRISTDNYLAGTMAGKAVLSLQEGDINVGIVNFDKNSANGQQREKGFTDAVFDDSRVSIIESINVISTIEDAKADTEAMLKAHPEINVVATFNEWTSLGVSYVINSMDLGGKTTVVAFDSNPVCVGMMETGEVDALIVQDPYAMGYLGVEYAYRLINKIPIESKEIDTTLTLVTRENMFDKEIQRVLFPFE